MNKYPYLVSIDYLEDFLMLNGIANTVVIDPASIDTFYGFSGHYFVKPTKKWVDMWWNYDCPDLYRYTTNKDRSKNMFGFNPFYWQNCLVNVCVSGAYIDRDITAEEVFAFGRGREHTDVVREMQAVLEGRQLAENEAKIKELTAIVQGYEAKIQAVIDKHTDEILQHMCDKGVLIRGNDGILKEKFFGLDCGFLNVYSENQEYKEAKRVLRNMVNVSSDFRAPWMHLQLPYFAQSLTVQIAGFEKIKELVENATGEKLYCTTMLD